VTRNQRQGHPLQQAPPALAMAAAGTPRNRCSKEQQYNCVGTSLHSAVRGEISFTHVHPCHVTEGRGWCSMNFARKNTVWCTC
jgi:hypothetical protein